MTSRESREQALKLVYQQCFSPELTTEEIAALNMDADDTRSDKFSISLAEKVKENLEELDGIIASKLVRWTIDRLPKLTLCILRLAVAEVLWFDKTPDSIVANEAVEFTKKYVGEKEAGFVNGVIGSVIRDKEEKNEAVAETGETDTAE